jgi:hypothetical protein
MEITFEFERTHSDRFFDFTKETITQDQLCLIIEDYFRQKWDDGVWGIKQGSVKIENIKL